MVNGSHHGENPLPRPTGIQTATKSYAALQAMPPTNIKTVHQTSLLHIESNLDRLGMLSPTHDQRSQQKNGKGCQSCSWSAEQRKSIFPCPRSRLRFGHVRQVGQSRPASACSYIYSDWIWCLLSRFRPSSAAASIYLLFKIAIRHRISPEVIGSSNYCVSMASTAESPPA